MTVGWKAVVSILEAIAILAGVLGVMTAFTIWIVHYQNEQHANMRDQQVTIQQCLNNGTRSVSDCKNAASNQ